MIEPKQLKTIHTRTLQGEIGRLVAPIFILAVNLNDKSKLIKENRLENMTMASAFLFALASDLLPFSYVVANYPDIPKLITLWPILLNHIVAYTALRISETIHRTE